jgi:hypothetical protein
MHTRLRHAVLTALVAFTCFGCQGDLGAHKQHVPDGQAVAPPPTDEQAPQRRIDAVVGDIRVVFTMPPGFENLWVAHHEEQDEALANYSFVRHDRSAQIRLLAKKEDLPAIEQIKQRQAQRMQEANVLAKDEFSVNGASCQVVWIRESQPEGATVIGVLASEDPAVLVLITGSAHRFSESEVSTVKEILESVSISWAK